MCSNRKCTCCDCSGCKSCLSGCCKRMTRCISENKQKSISSGIKSGFTWFFVANEALQYLENNMLQRSDYYPSIIAAVIGLGLCIRAYNQRLQELNNRDADKKEIQNSHKKLNRALRLLGDFVEEDSTVESPSQAKKPSDQIHLPGSVPASEPKDDAKTLKPKFGDTDKTTLHGKSKADLMREKKEQARKFIKKNVGKSNPASGYNGNAGKKKHPANKPNQDEVAEIKITVTKNNKDETAAATSKERPPNKRGSMALRRSANTPSISIPPQTNQPTTLTLADRKDLPANQAGTPDKKDDPKTIATSSPNASNEPKKTLGTVASVMSTLGNFFSRTQKPAGVPTTPAPTLAQLPAGSNSSLDASMSHSPSNASNGVISPTNAPHGEAKLLGHASDTPPKLDDASKKLGGQNNAATVSGSKSQKNAGLGRSGPGQPNKRASAAGASAIAPKPRIK